jgi:hypothetical protein
MTRIATAADLVAENCNLWLQCRGCGRVNTLTPHALAGRVFAPGEVRPELAALSIDAILNRLRCSSCGGRVADWTPMRRIY